MTFDKWVQSRLTAHGFPVGVIDGNIGPLTLAALKAFQAKHDLNATGMTGADTVKALRASATAVTPKEAAVMPDRVVSPPTSNMPAIGLDFSKAKYWPRQGDVPLIFGGVGERQTTIELPYPMYLAWDKAKMITRMTLHEMVAPSALRVLQHVETIYTTKERRALGIDLFGGSLNVRKMRGGSNYSMHSWGIAIDFDPERNGLYQTRGPVDSRGKPAVAARLSHADAIAFWQAWEIEGWLSLGRARDFDWMHVQAARL